MSSDLEKLVQQYADLYPYQPPSELPSELLSVATPSVSIEKTPPILKPIAKDLQLLPPKKQQAPPPKEVQKTHNISEWLCQENVIRGVLIVILVACLYMYFRKK